MTGVQKGAAAAVALAVAAAAAGGGYYAYARSKSASRRRGVSTQTKPAVPKPAALTAEYALTAGGENTITKAVEGGEGSSHFLVDAVFLHTGPTPEGVYKGYVQVKEATRTKQDLDAEYSGLFEATHRAEYEFTLYKVPASEGGGFKSDRQAAPFTTYLGEGTATGRGVVTTQPEQVLGDCVVWFRINGDPGGPNDDVAPVVTKAAVEIEGVGIFDAKLTRGTGAGG